MARVVSANSRARSEIVYVARATDAVALRLGADMRMRKVIALAARTAADIGQVVAAIVQQRFGGTIPYGNDAIRDAAQCARRSRGRTACPGLHARNRRGHPVAAHAAAVRAQPREPVARRRKR